MFCRSLFVLLYFFFRPLCCLFFFDIRILIAPLVSSNSSYYELKAQKTHRPNSEVTYMFLPPVQYFNNIYYFKYKNVAVMVNFAISAHHHWSYEFECRSGEMYSIQYYVIKFVSDLWQAGGYLRALRFPLKILIKVALNTIAHNHSKIKLIIYLSRLRLRW